ncbi:MAG: carboxypeptidase-like regulatory domain-containing protein [Planctomycetota bacterium]
MLRIHGTRGSLLEGETDGDGAFEFPWEDHDHRIEVEAPGFASQVALAELPATAITLVPGDPIHGRVVDLRGRPVAGCEVKIRTATWRAEGLGVFTGPDGGFESPPLPLEGSAELTLIHPDHPRLSERVDLGGKRERELVLADGASVGGRVRGPDGSTVSEGRVLLIPANPGRFYVRDLAGAAIGPDGSFRAGPVAPGEYTLLVEHPELAPVEIDLGMIAAGEAPRLAVRLPRGTAVSGRVVTPDGAPASGVRLKLGSIVGDEIRGPVTESGIDGSFLFTGVPHLSPIARPGLPDIRWKRILDEARGAAAEGKGGAADGAGEALRALILEIQRPADLLWKNREEIPGFGIFGSRNTCRVRPGARRLELVVRPLEEQRERLFELIHPSGAPLRTVTNLVIVPPDDPGARRIIVFGGTDGNPAKLHDPGAIEGCLVAFLSRRHATSFVQVEMEMDGAAAPMPVLLEEPRRPPPRIALRDRGGAPVAAQPLLFTPLFEDVAPFAAIYLGTTDGEGEVTAPFLAQGRYRISIPAEEVETGRWRPQITTLPLEGTRALGILDLAAEGDGEVMMELPAP